MTERLRDALTRLESALIATGYPIAEGLRPGLPEDAVRTRLAEIDVDPPDDLVTWFGWHDGYAKPADSDYRGWLGPAFAGVLTLEDACQVHVDIQDMFQIMATHTGEQTQWFPILRLDATSYVINYGDDAHTRGQVAVEDAGQILIGRDDRPASLVEPVELWVSYFEAGVWRWDGSRWLDDRTPEQVDGHPWAI